MRGGGVFSGCLRSVPLCALIRSALSPHSAGVLSVGLAPGGTGPGIWANLTSGPLQVEHAAHGGASYVPCAHCSQ